jgi:hypothetical protein
MPETTQQSTSPLAPARKPDLKTELFVAVSEAFPEPAEVQIKPLASGHQKLATRKLPPQYQVRVQMTGDAVEYKHVTVKEEGRDVNRLQRVSVTVPYAVCGMYPQDGSVAGIKAFVEELKSDAVRIVDGFPK